MPSKKVLRNSTTKANFISFWFAAYYRANQQKIPSTAPSQDELAFDTATFLSALRALAETSLTSSAFRLILADLFSIIRDLVEHAAAEAALQAQHIAEGVANKAREDDRFIMPDIDINETIEVVKDKGRQAVDEIEYATQAVKNEWKGVGDDIADKTKEKILERIKQVLFFWLSSRNFDFDDVNFVR